MSHFHSIRLKTPMPPSRLYTRLVDLFPISLGNGSHLRRTSRGSPAHQQASCPITPWLCPKAGPTYALAPPPQQLPVTSHFPCALDQSHCLPFLKSLDSSFYFPPLFSKTLKVSILSVSNSSQPMFPLNPFQSGFAC